MSTTPSDVSPARDTSTQASVDSTPESASVPGIPGTAASTSGQDTRVPSQAEASGLSNTIPGSDRVPRPAGVPAQVPAANVANPTYQTEQRSDFTETLNYSRVYGENGIMTEIPLGGDEVTRFRTETRGEYSTTSNNCDLIMKGGCVPQGGSQPQLTGLSFSSVNYGDGALTNNASVLPTSYIEEHMRRIMAVRANPATNANAETPESMMQQEPSLR
ncbi:hypothetical protein VNI00_009822 [Paramarasmius palmivorus]|uniref:Uncharacterized protein n=1 Tax=Paramarasmius palmivorus TaxID=297713 RepID=A0AAW0CPF7_9AGAR